MLKAIILDRDGVINKKMPEGYYVKSWSEFQFLPSSKDALKLLNQYNYKVFIITNQRGIAKGLYTEEQLEAIHQRMVNEIEQAGGKIEKVYYCPHDYNQCKCRKPEIGMFLQLQEDYPKINFQNIFFIGDSETDLEAGKSIGSKLGHIKRNYKKSIIEPDIVGTNLLEIVNKVLDVKLS